MSGELHPSRMDMRLQFRVPLNRLIFVIRSKIVVTSNSPSKAQWQDHRVRFIAVDFLQPLEAIVKKLKQHCSDVTHAYYCSYIHKYDNDFDNLWQQNVPLFQNFLNAIDIIAAKSLQRVCLQTGGKVTESCQQHGVKCNRR